MDLMVPGGDEIGERHERRYIHGQSSQGFSRPLVILDYLLACSGFAQNREVCRFILPAVGPAHFTQRRSLRRLIHYIVGYLKGEPEHQAVAPEALQQSWIFSVGCPGAQFYRGGN